MVGCVMDKAFTVNSTQSLNACCKWLTDLQKEHGFITVAKPRIGKDRSLDQNALFHAWCTEIVAYFMNVNPKTVAKNEMNGVKRTMKKMFQQAHPETSDWMVYEVRCPITGASKRDFTSSASWKTGEMFMFLEWMQFWAMELDPMLVLESRGEFDKKQREQNV